MTFSSSAAVEMAFLTKGLKIILVDKREGMEREKTFHVRGRYP